MLGKEEEGDRHVDNIQGAETDADLYHLPERF